MYRRLSTTVSLVALLAGACRTTAKPGSEPSEASAAPSERLAGSGAAPAGSGKGPPSATAPPASAAVPTDAAAPVGGNWLRCYSGFSPRNEPEREVQRLGLLCGPVNGMRKVASATDSARDDGGTAREHRFQAEVGDCYRIFAVADPGVFDLDVEVLAPDGRRVARDTGDDRWPIVNPDGPFCLHEAGEYRAVVRAARGAGSYGIEIWRLR